MRSLRPCPADETAGRAVGEAPKASSTLPQGEPEPEPERAGEPPEPRRQKGFPITQRGDKLLHAARSTVHENTHGAPGPRPKAETTRASAVSTPARISSGSTANRAASMRITLESRSATRHTRARQSVATLRSRSSRLYGARSGCADRRASALRLPRE